MSLPALLKLGLLLLGLLLALGFAAPFFYPIDPRLPIDPAHASLLPPGAARVLVSLRDGRLLAADLVRKTDRGLQLIRKDSIEEIPAEALARGLDPPWRTHRFLLGTDRLGRDLLARVLAATRVSLAVAMLSVGVLLAVGLPLGALAALAPGVWGRVLLGFIELVQAFPRVFLLLALAATFRGGVLAVVLWLGLSGWVPAARLFRAELRAVRQRPFVLALIALGLGPARIFFRHLVPNSLAPIWVEASLAAAGAVVAEAALSFLGFGVPPPTPSWGSMIAEGRDLLESAWWVAIVPGAFTVTAALSFLLLGEGLRERLDPKPARL